MPGTKKRARERPDSKLVLVGAGNPRKRKETKRDWTLAKTVDFLTSLAETCNVTRAAEEAGVSTGSAYARRKKDAAFRAGWAEAIATAYQRLELELLARSLNGTEKVVKRRDGSEELMRDYSNQTALALLRMHRDSASEGDGRAGARGRRGDPRAAGAEARAAAAAVRGGRRVRQVKITRRQMELLANSARDEKVAFVATLTPIDALRWDAHFESSAHKSQRPPPAEGWRIGLMMAGRGFGKTRAGAEWIEQLARSRPGVRLALVGASIEEARRIMVEGVSGVMSVAKRNRSRVRWEPSIGRLIWSNGSEAQLFSGDSPDGMRGPEHDFAWCGELAKWRYREAAWDNLQMLDTIVAAAVEEPPRNDPPATPITGNCFIVGIAPSGAWTGRASALAAFSAAGWRFVAPTEGLQAWVKSSSTWAVYQGGAWEVGAVRASRLMTGGVQVVGLQSGAIADAAGGTTVDAQARATIGEILTALRVHGLIASA